MAVIDIGAAAINRGSSVSWYCKVGKENPADASGTITTIEIWMNSKLTASTAVETVIDEGSNVLSTRDWVNIGVVPSGSKQTYSGLDIDVETGDYLGVGYSGGGGSLGSIERDLSGEGYWDGGTTNTPYSSTSMTWYADRTLSLYGEGETAPPPGPTGKSSWEFRASNRRRIAMGKSAFYPDLTLG